MKKELEFIGNSKKFFIISMSIIVLGLLCTVIFGVKLDIEFSGGTMLTYVYEGEIDPDAFKASAEEFLGGTEVSVNTGTDFTSGKNKIQIEVNSKEGLNSDGQYELTQKLGEAYAVNSPELVESSDVSPSSGRTFFLKCLVAVVFSSVVLVIYIAVRFKNIGGWLAGVCAVIALFHDIFVVYAVFVIFRMDIDANFMAVVLTILGYSINDTIVIYDRIRENQRLLKKEKLTLAQLTNKSINQSLRRSIYTSVTTVMAMLTVSIVALIFGADSIISFSFPVMIGMISGTYSSVCVSGPLWVYFENKRSGKNNGSGAKAKAKKVNA